MSTHDTDPKGEDPRLSESLYEELRTLAERHMFGEPDDHTLQPTALVHEAWLRMRDPDEKSTVGPRGFQALAARVLRRVLVDHARRRRASKRGGGRMRETLSDPVINTDGVSASMIDLEEALAKLARLNERHARVVELRFFSGMTTEEIAQTLDVSKDTVKRDWRLTRAWLHRELDQGGDSQ